MAKIKFVSRTPSLSQRRDAALRAASGGQGRQGILPPRSAVSINRENSFVSPAASTSDATSSPADKAPQESSAVDGAPDSETSVDETASLGSLTKPPVGPSQQDLSTSPTGSNAADPRLSETSREGEFTVPLIGKKRKASHSDENIDPKRKVSQINGQVPSANDVFGNIEEQVELLCYFDRVVKAAGNDEQKKEALRSLSVSENDPPSFANSNRDSISNLEPLTSGDEQKKRSAANVRNGQVVKRARPPSRNSETRRVVPIALRPPALENANVVMHEHYEVLWDFLWHFASLHHEKYPELIKKLTPVSQTEGFSMNRFQQSVHAYLRAGGLSMIVKEMQALSQAGKRRDLLELLFILKFLYILPIGPAIKSSGNDVADLCAAVRQNGTEAQSEKLVRWKDETIGLVADAVLKRWESVPAIMSVPTQSLRKSPQNKWLREIEIDASLIQMPPVEYRVRDIYPFLTDQVVRRLQDDALPPRVVSVLAIGVGAMDFDPEKIQQATHRIYALTFQHYVLAKQKLASSATDSRAKSIKCQVYFGLTQAEAKKIAHESSCLREITDKPTIWDKIQAVRAICLSTSPDRFWTSTFKQLLQAELNEEGDLLGGLVSVPKLLEIGTLPKDVWNLLEECVQKTRVWARLIWTAKRQNENVPDSQQQQQQLPEGTTAPSQPLGPHSQELGNADAAADGAVYELLQEYVEKISSLSHSDQSKLLHISIAGDLPLKNIAAAYDRMQGFNAMEETFLKIAALSTSQEALELYPTFHRGVLLNPRYFGLMSQYATAKPKAHTDFVAWCTALTNQKRLKPIRSLSFRKWNLRPSSERDPAYSFVFSDPLAQNVAIPKHPYDLIFCDIPSGERKTSADIEWTYQKIKKVLKVAAGLSTARRYAVVLFCNSNQYRVACQVMESHFAPRVQTLLWFKGLNTAAPENVHHFESVYQHIVIGYIDSRDQSTDLWSYYPGGKRRRRPNLLPYIETSRTNLEKGLRLTQSKGSKPLSLTRALVQELCPKGGTVLDLICSKDSFMLGALLEGMNAVGVCPTQGILSVLDNSLIGLRDKIRSRPSEAERELLLKYDPMELLEALYGEEMMASQPAYQ